MSQTITEAKLKSKEDNLICDIKSIIKEKTEDKLNAISETSEQLKQKISDIKEDVQNEIKSIVNDVSVKKQEITTEISQAYQKTPIAQWRSARPDITLLIEVIIIISILITIYFIWPQLSAAKSPIFSKEQYLLAKQQSESSYSIDELSKVRVELKAMDDYFKYFNSPPYSIENQGLLDLNRGVIFLPILSFIIIYIVPPFVILYIIWFIITYWKYVIAALWGWFLMIYSFGTKLIECKLASKWYIRMVTGWSECSPNFSDYFNRWRKEYVDIPVYYEKLKYVQEYYAAKQKYYTIPKRYYIDLPRDRYEIKKEYLRKVYVDRALDVFLRKLLDWYQVYYERPRDELYQYVLGSNQNLAALWAKMHQSQKQILGLPYESVTKSGNKCSCPATKTPLKIIDDIVTNNLDLAKKDINIAVTKVKDLYDTISQEREQNELDCKKLDVIVNNRNNIYFTLLLTVIIIGICVFSYSCAYGTPHWLKAWISPIWKFTSINMRPTFIAKLPDYSLYFIIIMIFFVVGSVLYKIRSI